MGGARSTAEFDERSEENSRCIRRVGHRRVRALARTLGVETKRLTANHASPRTVEFERSENSRCSGKKKFYCWRRPEDART